MSPTFVRVSITLPEEQLALIDQLRAERDLSRSGFIQAVIGFHSSEVAQERLDAYLRVVMRITDRLAGEEEERRRGGKNS